ncbi:MAG: response regulator [Gemmataceae bacterium]
MAKTLPVNVLVVDDDPDTRSNLCDILELDGHHVETAGSKSEVLERTDWQTIEAVILDRNLQDGTAEELLPHLRQRAPHAAILIVTGYSDLQGVIAALRQGAADYILKPINPDVLRASLARIADRQRLAREKARIEAAFQMLVEAAPSFIVLLRPDRRIVYINRFAEDGTGFRSQDVVGKDYFDTFLPVEYRGLVEEYLEKVRTQKEVRGIEYPVQCRDGSNRWVLWNAQMLEATSLPTISGTPEEEEGPIILAIGQDISALRQSQERTLQAERLAAIGQMVTGLAHESGNALARSQACLEMLELEVQDRPEALELLERIQNAQDHLEHLYEEVRNYAAPLRLEREPWPLDAVWRQAWANLSKIRMGRVAHLAETGSGRGVPCSIDTFRIEQVFRNILENSLAVCADPVEISVDCAETTLDGLPALEVIVRDNGPGLTPEVRRRLFEPFFTTKTKGTGLGMAISKRIVEAHGGIIDADSVRIPGRKGAEIVMVIPRDFI